MKLSKMSPCSSDLSCIHLCPWSLIYHFPCFSYQSWRFSQFLSPCFGIEQKLGAVFCLQGWPYEYSVSQEQFLPERIFSQATSPLQQFPLLWWRRTWCLKFSKAVIIPTLLLTRMFTAYWLHSTNLCFQIFQMARTLSKSTYPPSQAYLAGTLGRI